MKKIILLLLITLTLFSCSKKEENNIENIGVKKIKIQTSIISIASITNYIGGDLVEVNSIVPVGVSPHGYDLKPEKMVDIEKSDLIIYLNLDHIDAFLNKVLNKEKSLVVSEKIDLLEGSKEKHEDEHKDEDENEEHEQENHSIDPHVWTSSKNAILIAETITQKLSSIKPEEKIYFENNLLSFKKELENIKNEFLIKNQNKKTKEFIVFHDAYNYLFDDLNIKKDKKIVFQKNVLSDPNSAEMKELIDEIKLHSVNIAFKEPQLNDSNLQKLSIDYNLKVEILDPLGKDITKNGYIDNFKNNLINLEKIYE